MKKNEYIQNIINHLSMSHEYSEQYLGFYIRNHEGEVLHDSKFDPYVSATDALDVADIMNIDIHVEGLSCRVSSENAIVERSLETGTIMQLLPICITECASMEAEFILQQKEDVELEARKSAVRMRA